MSKNLKCHNCAQTSQFGCEQNLEEIDFERSIHNACVVGDFEKVKKLIIQDKELVNCQDKNGYSALHYAARNNFIDICRYLLENGANVDLKTKSCQSTALHRACFVGNYEIVQLLLNFNSNIFDKDCDFKTPFQKALDQLIIKNEPIFEKILKLLIAKDKRIIDEKDKFNKSVIELCPKIRTWIE